MNKWLERAIIFAAGAALGSSAVIFGLKKKLEADYADKYEQEVAYDKEAYRRARKNLEFVKSEKEATDNLHFSEPEEVKEYKDVSSIYSSTPEKVNAEPKKYDSIYDTPKNDYPEPYFISLDDFGEKENYDSVTIYHYDNDIFAYEDGDYVDDLKKVLGSDFINALEHHNLKDICYIRSEFMERDYEIIREYITYDESVDTTPRKIGG